MRYSTSHTPLPNSTVFCKVSANFCRSSGCTRVRYLSTELISDAFFPFLSKNEKIFLKRLKVNIVENIDSTNITYDDLCNKFGYPSDIIISYFEDQDANYLIKQSRIRNILKKAIIICTVAILVCCLWRGILIYKSYRDSENSKVKYIEYTIEEVN